MWHLPDQLKQMFVLPVSTCRELQTQNSLPDLSVPHLYSLSDFGQRPHYVSNFFLIKCQAFSIFIVLKSMKYSTESSTSGGVKDALAGTGAASKTLRFILSCPAIRTGHSTSHS